MSVKTKLILKYPLIGWRNRRARSLAKKANKELNEDKYPIQWKNDYVIKKAKKFTKELRIDLEVIGFENIPKQSSIIAPNHQSAFDPVVLIAALSNPDRSSDSVNPRALFIAKEELRKNKRVRGYMDLLNTFYIPRKNPRKALEGLNDAVVQAKEHHKHLVIFPEGTRTKDGELQTFKGGAFRIAKKSFLPIVPVTINNTLEASSLTRKNKVKVQVIFHQPLKPMSFMTSSNDAIGERVKKIIAKKYVKPTVSNNAESKLA